MVLRGPRGAGVGIAIGIGIGRGAGIGFAGGADGVGANGDGRSGAAGGVDVLVLIFGSGVILGKEGAGTLSFFRGGAEGFGMDDAPGLGEPAFDDSAGFTAGGGSEM